jgi:uncharacterized protein (DUF1499 family)
MHEKEFNNLSMPHYDLKPCPNKPNCVSSLNSDKTRAVEPLQYVGDWQTVKKSLLGLIENLPRAVVVEHHNQYVHATFKSKIFGFVDDVEFLFDDTQKLIQIRSASRMGYYDFGANRQRVEMLRAWLTP